MGQSCLPESLYPSLDFASFMENSKPNNESDAVVLRIEMLTQSQSRKESIPNYLMMKGPHFKYERGARKVCAKVNRLKMLPPKPQEVGMRNYNGKL